MRKFAASAECRANPDTAPSRNEKELGWRQDHFYKQSPYGVFTIVIANLLLVAMGHAAEPASTPKLTFTKHVAPLIFAHCASCHRPGQPGPFNLLTYDDVKKRARQIAEVVEFTCNAETSCSPKRICERR